MAKFSLLTRKAPFRITDTRPGEDCALMLVSHLISATEKSTVCSFRRLISKIPNTCHRTVLPTSVFCLYARIICSLHLLYETDNGEFGYSLRLDGGIVRGGNVVGQGDAEATSARWCFRSFSHGSLRKSPIFLRQVHKWQSSVSRIIDSPDKCHIVAIVFLFVVTG